MAGKGRNTFGAKIKKMKKMIFLLVATFSMAAIHAQKETGKTKDEKAMNNMIPHGKPGHVCDKNCPMNPDYKKTDMMIPHGQPGHVCDKNCPMNPKHKKTKTKMKTMAMIPHGQAGHVCDKHCPMNPKYKKPK
jgi:hypothetical protein